VSSNAATAVGDGAGFPRSPSANAAAAAMRYEEAAMQRAELEAVKRENEILRARVKELEKSLSKSNEATSEMTPASGAAPSVS